MDAALRQAGREQGAVGRYRQVVDRRRQPAEQPGQRLSLDIEQVDAEAGIPLPTGGTGGEHAGAVRGQGDRIQLAFLQGADRWAQHPARRAVGQRPQADGLVVARTGEQPPGGVGRQVRHRAGVPACLDAQERGIRRRAGGAQHQGQQQEQQQQARPARQMGGHPGQLASSKPLDTACWDTATEAAKSSRLAALLPARLRTSLSPRPALAAETTRGGGAALRPPASVSSGA